MESRRGRGWAVTLAGYGFLGSGVVVVLVPLLWVVDTSFKTIRQAESYPPLLAPTAVTLRNYDVVFGSGGFRHTLMVSAEVTIGTVIIALAVAVPTAYALSRLRHRAVRLLVPGLVLIECIPLVALVIPLYSLLSDAHLYDTVPGLILVYAGLLIPFATWVNLAFLQGLPTEVEEAAAVDGASLGQRLRFVIIPLLRPAMGAAGLFTAIAAWNQFLVPVILAESRAETLTVWITQFVSQTVIDWGALCASAVVLMLPIVIVALVAQRQLVGGLTMGMLKG